MTHGDVPQQPAPPAPAAADDRFRILVQNVSDHAMYILDPTGHVTLWTEGAVRVKGYSEKEALGKHISLFYPPEEVAKGVPELEMRTAEAEGRAEREGYRVRKGGERFWANETMTPIRDAAGRLTGFAKIARDLSGRKRIEDALRESEARHRLLVENVRDHGIFTIDPEGRVASWNPGAERIFGYATREIVGQPASVLFTPEEVATGEHTKELSTAASEGRASDDRWQVRKGGERFWASGVTSAMHDLDGRLLGFTKVLRDLTDEKQTQEQRERLLAQEKVARLEAEKAITMKDEFLAVVSHELRTPLTVILMWAKMLKARMVTEADHAEVFETIEQSAVAQQQLIEDLLDVSRMMSGKLRLNVREADLAGVVRAAIDAVRPTADAKAIEVEASLDERVGRVGVDPDRIQQVVWNLVNNAVKFTGRGGRVRVTLRRVNGDVQIQVSDTGQGIGAHFLPHLFQRFRQADASTTRVHGGLGLGLSITRQLVELHGGTIRAESPGEGKGATFTVELPLRDVRAALAYRPPAAGRSGDGAASKLEPVLEGVRVLLVEDEAKTRAAVRWTLEQCKAHVTAVESAALAVAAFRESLRARRFHVLVSDIGMPIQDGYELIREIREMEKQRGETQPVPAAALTAYAGEDYRARAEAAGFQAHVPKPVEPEFLVSTVAALAASGGERQSVSHERWET